MQNRAIKSYYDRTGGHYKIILHDDSVPKEDYEKVQNENIQLRTKLGNALKILE